MVNSFKKISSKKCSYGTLYNNKLIGRTSSVCSPQQNAYECLLSWFLNVIVLASPPVWCGSLKNICWNYYFKRLWWLHLCYRGSFKKLTLVAGCNLCSLLTYLSTYLLNALLHGMWLVGSSTLIWVHLGGILRHSAFRITQKCSRFILS